jgi:uncharacterized protein YjdB
MNDTGCTSSFNDIDYYKVVIATPVTGVTISASSLLLSIGDIKQLADTIIPYYATNTSVLWSSDSTSIVTVDSKGKINAIAKGTAHITVTTVDGGKTASCTAVVAGPSSINQVENLGFKLYPNPLYGTNLSIEGISGSMEIIITDISGRKQYGKKILADGVIILTDINLESGIYFISIIQHGHQSSEQFVITK